MPPDRSNPYSAPQSETFAARSTAPCYPATRTRTNGIEELAFEVNGSRVRVTISGLFTGPHYSVIVEEEEVIGDGEAGPERVVSVGAKGDQLRVYVYGYSLTRRQARGVAVWVNDQPLAGSAVDPAKIRQASSLWLLLTLPVIRTDFPFSWLTLQFHWDLVELFLALPLIPVYFLAGRVPRLAFAFGIGAALLMLLYRVAFRMLMPPELAELLIYFPIELFVRLCLLAAFIRGYRAARAEIPR